MCKYVNTIQYYQYFPRKILCFRDIYYSMFFKESVSRVATMGKQDLLPLTGLAWGQIHTDYKLCSCIRCRYCS